MKSLAEMIAVMQAAKRGEQIESKPKGLSEWRLNSNPAWDWDSFEYRVAPRTMEIVVVAWLVRPDKPFVLDMSAYKDHHSPDRLVLISTQTITY